RAPRYLFVAGGIGITALLPMVRAAEGAVVGCPCAIPSGDSTGPLKDWADKYKASAKVDPAIYATEGYDAATTFINAVKAGKVTGTDINDFLKTEDFTGISKPIKFKDNGEPVTNSIFIYQVVGGKIKLLGPSDTAKLQG
ncbi:ABC transporter substrate-binding protein, partial [Kibdelosporangium lantanae]